MKTVTISGTDPANPKTAGHIRERLEQINRDVNAMREEVARLHVYAGYIRDVMLDQGRGERAASAAAESVRSLIGSLDDQLETSAAYAGRAAEAITANGVNVKARFEWRPTR